MTTSSADGLQINLFSLLLVARLAVIFISHRGYTRHSMRRFKLFILQCSVHYLYIIRKSNFSSTHKTICFKPQNISKKIFAPLFEAWSFSMRLSNFIQSSAKTDKTLLPHPLSFSTHHAENFTPLMIPKKTFWQNNDSFLFKKFETGNKVSNRIFPYKNLLWRSYLLPSMGCSEIASSPLGLPSPNTQYHLKPRPSFLAYGERSAKLHRRIALCTPCALFHVKQAQRLYIFLTERTKIMRLFKAFSPPCSEQQRTPQ